MKYLVIIISTLCSTACLAQSSDITELLIASEKRGDKLYDRWEYEAAVDQYQIASRKSGSYSVHRKLGRSYYKLRDFTNAYTYYNAYDHEMARPIYDSLDLLYFAESALATGNLDQAAEKFQEYYDATGDKRGLARLEGVRRNAQYFANESFFEMKNLAVNTRASEMIGEVFRDGFTFASSRNSELDLYSLYYAVLDSSGQFVTKKVEVPHIFYQESSPTFMGDSVVILSAIRFGAGHTTTQLYIGDIISETEWGNFHHMQVPVSHTSILNPHYDDQTGILHFAADLPGGYGGFDLYTTYILNGNWTKPENMGPTINTSGNEFYPYTFNGQFYFTSDGHPGAGGYDIYQYDDIHDEIVNMNAPVNSAFDDFGLHLNNRFDGFFSSNRNGGVGGDDIYEFTSAELDLIGVNIELRRKWNNTKISGARIIMTDLESGASFSFASDSSGNIFAKVPKSKDYRLTVERPPLHTLIDTVKVHGVPLDETFYMVRDFKMRAFVFSDADGTAVQEPVIFVKNLETNERQELRANTSGYFELDKKSGSRYSIVISKEGYDFLNDTILFDRQEFNTTYSMHKITPTETVTLNDLLYETNSHVLASDLLPSLDSIANNLKKFPNTNILIISHTDSKGSDDYNRELSLKRSLSVMDYLESKGVAIEKMRPAGRGELELLNECADGVPCTEEQHRENRRTEIQIFRGN